MNDGELQHRFGQRIRELRVDRGLSQERLAALSQLHRTYISSLERGDRNVSLQNISTLAKALDVPLSALMDGLDDE